MQLELPYAVWLPLGPALPGVHDGAQRLPLLQVSTHRKQVVGATSASAQDFGPSLLSPLQGLARHFEHGSSLLLPLQGLVRHFEHGPSLPLQLQGLAKHSPHGLPGKQQEVGWELVPWTAATWAG